MENDGKIVLPGEFVTHADDSVVAGTGLLEDAGCFHSVLFGRVATSPAVSHGSSPSSSSSGGPTAVRIVKPMEGRDLALLPRVGDVVFCRVIRLELDQVRTRVLSVGDTPIPEPRVFYGLIRKRDIRKLEVDKIKIPQCFALGDIVRARILLAGGGGGSASYEMSTAENELGVVFSQSRHGFPLIPTSWVDAVCSHTRTRERRKFAKIPSGTQPE